MSPGAQTRRANKKFTGGSQALNVHNTDKTSFEQEKKKNMYVLLFIIQFGELMLY